MVNMAYESITLKTEIEIKDIISIHYFEYMSDFSFGGETHDFWELLCVDKGVVNVVADTTLHTLNKGDIIFHKPNEFHDVRANGIIAPNLVVIGFACHSPAMDFFRDKILRIGDAERSLLAKIVAEARTVYSCRLDDPYCAKLTRKDTFPFGAEQQIQMYLQQLLIRLIRIYSSDITLRPSLLKNTQQRSEDELLTKIISYMEDNISTRISIEQICKDNLVGRSILQKLFQKYKNCGIIDYFCNMKIETAKQLIRNQNINFTQIAESLGYNSIHYFSRQFKKLTGMTPSEYASSIKSISETPAENHREEL